MKTYIEAVEQVPVAAEFIRIEVTGKSLAEEALIISDIKAVMTGQTYILRRHFCYHEEGNSCTMEVV